MVRLESMALIGSTDSYGYKVISLFDNLDDLVVQKYSPKNAKELNNIEKQLTQDKKYKCIFICTYIFQKNKNHSQEKERILPVGLRLLKTLREKNSINKDSKIFVIGEKGDYGFEKKAKEYGADKYIC